MITVKDKIKPTKCHERQNHLYTNDVEGVTFTRVPRTKRSEDSRLLGKTETKGGRITVKNGTKSARIA